MKLTNKKLRNLILEEFDLLLEAEPEEEEEATDEEPEEEEEEEEATDEEPEEDEIYVSPEEQASLSRSADDQILAYLIDFETKAMKSATVAADNTLRVAPDVEIEVEWYKRPLGDMLFEEESSSLAAAAPGWVGSTNIDIATFAADVSRLIDNYDSLLDMEALIINKAKDYILDKYDQETTTYFEELMDVKHDKYVGETQRQSDEDDVPPAPQALGSMDTGGGA